MSDAKRQLDDELVALIDSHYLSVYRYGYRLTGSAADAEDITQQTFLKVQSRMEQLRDKNSAKSWLFTIARNIFLKSLRDNKIPPVSLDSVAEPFEETTLHLDFDSEALQSAINDLPEEYRSPLILYYFREFSYKEIASQLDVPMGTVMSRLARAKSALRTRLTPNHSPAIDS
ncbi:MAG: hypothetical protein Tsb009_31030 [Planctomycetaceae bacterium]